MDICFILYRPAVPGNVGAAARAITTMGFRDLRLIRPCNHLCEEAMTMAHGSHHVLQNAKLYRNFEEATADLDLVVCTTAKGRTAKHDYHSSRDIRTLLASKSEPSLKAGFLFGTEESGLPNRLVLKSDLAMSIPMNAPYPSLNLAQAVMVTAYELSPLNRLGKPGKQQNKSAEGWGTLRDRAARLLTDSGIREGTPLYHRIMERLATAGSNDIPLFLSVLNKIRRDPDQGSLK